MRVLVAVRPGEEMGREDGEDGGELGTIIEEGGGDADEDVGVGVGGGIDETLGRGWVTVAFAGLAHDRVALVLSGGEG